MPRIGEMPGDPAKNRLPRSALVQAKERLGQLALPLFHSLGSACPSKGRRENVLMSEINSWIQLVVLRLRASIPRLC
jgi:hypothetical protein